MSRGQSRRIIVRMAYDEKLAKRVSVLIAKKKGFREQKMFGGVGFLLHNNMCVGVWREYLILRLGIERAGQALKSGETRPFDITGHVMKGWVMVKPAGTKTDSALKAWVSQSIAFVSKLPRK